MIDLSKVKVGDHLTFRGKVVAREPQMHLIKVVFGNSTQIYRWVGSEDILTHEPRELKVGDFVTWGTCNVNYEIVAIKGNQAVLYHCTLNPVVKCLHDLTPVETYDET